MEKKATIASYQSSLGGSTCYRG